ncbi:hypothetical protein E4U13_003190 [Claviceps humidiphila]|uniref:Uncharacterized protein n=1 Tax=Claviceps humidiphila TaxID=1294629 RepID=A0A9P7PXX3_9HYPO|nr:hypothetical protein E4U13_003190 [Claviceps humidiphila]
MLWWRALAIHTPEYCNCQIFRSTEILAPACCIIYLEKVTAVTDAAAYEDISGNNRKVETVTRRLDVVVSTSYRISRTSHDCSVDLQPTGFH